MMQQSRSSIIGLSVLGIMTIFAAVWMYWQGNSQPNDKPILAAMQGAADLSRFNADAWFLPKEELLGFVEIPAGSFTMGSDPDIDAQAFATEKWSEHSRQGVVDVPIFYIARYEVTVAQFRCFVEATQHSANAQSLNAAADHPVTQVTWTDALAYSRWLEGALKNSSQTPALLQTLLHNGWHIGLPNEAQWEKAARGADGRIFPWGNSPNRERANYRSAGTTSVGRFNCDECAFGLADMSGNVWELTRSPYKPYPFDAANDRSDLHNDALFVMRGGAFNSDVNTIRAAVRGGVDPGARGSDIGFRLVLVR